MIRGSVIWVVTGRFCPSDANPETDTSPQTVEVGARTLAEARMLALWYRRADDPSRDGEIRKVGK